MTMDYVHKLIELDRRLHMRLPMAPITTRPVTAAERRCRDALRKDAREHAAIVAEAVGVSPA